MGCQTETARKTKRRNEKAGLVKGSAEKWEEPIILAWGKEIYRKVLEDRPWKMSM